MPPLKPLNRALNALIMHKQKVAQIGQNLGAGMMAYKQGGDVLFAPAMFWAALTSSLTPAVGSGATFTRGASTAGTIIDHEGVIRDVTANEARFLGARRVQNIIASSNPNDWTSRGSISSIVQNGTYKGQPVYRVTSNGGIAAPTVADVIVSEANRDDEIINSFYIKYISGTFFNPTQGINIRNGDNTVVSTTANEVYAMTEFTRVASQVTVVPGSYYYGFSWLQNTEMVFDICMMQSEDVTGQSNQAPSEYVSVGVGSGAELQVNGDFATDDTSTDGTLTEWEWAGTTWSIHDGKAYHDSGAAAFIHGSDTKVVPGRLYAVAYTLGKDTVFDAPINILFADTTQDIEGNPLGITEDTHYHVVRATTDSGLVINGAIAGHDLWVDNVSIKEINHGSNVDGVKYFDTLNGNTVASNVVTEGTGAAIPATTLRGILIENGSTNRLLDSEVFLAASSAWSNQGCTPVIHSTEVSPMGSKNVTDLFADNLGGTSDAVQVLQAASMVSSAPFSFSVYAKANTLDWMSLETSAFTAGNGNSFFDLANGVVGNLSIAHEDSYMEDMGNGWYRCVVTVADVGADNNGIFRIRLASANGNNVVNLDGTEGIYIVGAQAEASLIRATSYMPTEGSTTNRGIERLTYELPAAIAAVISELSVYAECYQWYNTGVLSRAISINSVTTGNIYYMAVNAIANWMTIAFNGGIVGIAEGIADVDGTKLCDALIDGSLSLTQDGLAEVVDITAPANLDFSNSDTTFDIGSSEGSTQFLNGTVKDVKLWGVALTEDQRISLTS